jgi:hypothetical protein
MRRALQRRLPWGSCLVHVEPQGGKLVRRVSSSGDGEKPPPAPQAHSAVITGVPLASSLVHVTVQDGYPQKVRELRLEATVLLSH